MSVKMFDTFEEMVAYEQENRRLADALIFPWQRDLKPGDFVLRVTEIEGSPLVIYGEILDVIELERPHYDLNSAESRQEFHSVEERYKVGGSWHQSFRFGRFYSPLCPEGEYGDIHLSTVTCPLPTEVFNRAREKGWPQILPRGR